MTALSVVAAVPASGQEFGPLQIAPHEGAPGHVVDAVVDPGVVAENCGLDVEEFLGELADSASDGALAEAMEEFGDDRGWPGGFTDPPNQLTDPESFAAYALLTVFIGIITNEHEAGEDAFARTFALTFADVVTQEPVGELSTFDPFTGVGQVDVPAVAPGIWAVAALCLGWNPAPTNEGTLAPAVAAGAEWVVENFDPPFPVFTVEILNEIGPVMLGADPQGEGILQVQGGPWVDLFCVVETDGRCHPDLRDVILTDLLEEELLLDQLLDDLLADERAAEAVGASPRFTG